MPAIHGHRRAALARQSVPALQMVSLSLHVTITEAERRCLSVTDQLWSNLRCCVSNFRRCRRALPDLRLARGKIDAYPAGKTWDLRVLQAHALSKDLGW